MSTIHIFYRMSDQGYQKPKPLYINNKNCLQNILSAFGHENIHLITDSVTDETYEWASHLVPQIERTFFGNGARSFNHALDYALQLSDNEIVYFVEGDYLHRKEAPIVLLEGFQLGADYVSLYDHPDKFRDSQKGGNPLVQGGGEVTRVFLSQSCHWKLTNSTTMTFASKVQTLREDEPILREYTSGPHPHDFQMFLNLRKNERTLITPLPGYATHGESTWLSPLTDWEAIAHQP